MLLESQTGISVFFVIFIVTLFTVFFLSKYAPKVGLLALPGEHRLHKIATPMVGGIAIYLSLLLGVFTIDKTATLLLPSLFLICAVGALDDRFALPSWVRFLAQGISAYLMVYFTNVVLVDLGYLLSGSARVVMVNYWPAGLTIFACIGVINAVNMSDGLDGLAGSLVLVVLITLLLVGHPLQNLILVTASSVAAFLCWNLRIGRDRAKVFLGDAGSMMLGLLLAYLLIFYSQFEGGIYPVTALWLLALPLIDAVSVLIVRPLRGRSPFSADRIHYHHQLLDKGLSVNGTLLVALVLQILFIVLGVFLWVYKVAEYLQLILFLSIFFSYSIRLYYFSAKISKYGNTQ